MPHRSPKVQFSLEQMRAFCAIVEKGGYQKAAESLHRSHSAIIYLVKGLESELGVKLLDRNQYRNRLTPKGEKVYHKCRDILNSASELHEFCGHLLLDWESQIKIVFDGIYPLGSLLEIYQHFAKKKIPTRVELHSAYLKEVETTANQLKADVIIAVVPLSEPKDWTPITLSPVKNILVAHKDHPVHKSSKKWKLKELMNFHFLTVRNTGSSMGMNTAELEESSSIFLSDFHFKKMAILNKIGFGWLPDHLIQIELQSGLLLPLNWERGHSHKLQPTMYIRKTAQNGKAVQLIQELILQ